MKHSFKNISPHSFKTILLKHLPTLAIAAGIGLLLKFYRKNSDFIIPNWDIYFSIFLVLLGLFVLFQEDFIEEVIVDKKNKKIEIYYYNIYQNKMIKTWDLNEFSASVETSFKKKVLKINFYRNKNLGFTLKKRKDNFSQENLNEIHQLLQEMQLIKTK